MASLSFDLNGKAALVTGGTSGIGKAIAEALLDHGARVLVGSRKAEKVEAAQKDLGQGRAEGALLAAQLDVADHASIDAAVDRCREAFGSIDILVNCAGVNMKKATLEATDEEERFIMDVNFFGPLYACKAVARKMIDAGRGGSIVNVCSVTSFLALSEVTTYACSKGALLALTRQLAVEWTKQGIRTNAVAPGFIPADQNREILKSGDRGRRILENTPLERFGDPEEIAGAVVYLCSDAGRFVNGECINIDGGFMIHGVSDSVPRDTA
jgi:NAD(P)-dependent dehydrogenase (short-subunit alcohol dehydrogenase family)